MGRRNRFQGGLLTRLAGRCGLLRADLDFSACGPLPTAACVSAGPGSWLLPQRRIQETEADAASELARRYLCPVLRSVAEAAAIGCVRGPPRPQRCCGLLAFQPRFPHKVLVPNGGPEVAMLLGEDDQKGHDGVSGKQVAKRTGQ